MTLIQQIVAYVIGLPLSFIVGYALGRIRGKKDQIDAFNKHFPHKDKWMQ